MYAIDYSYVIFKLVYAIIAAAKKRKAFTTPRYLAILFL